MTDTQASSIKRSFSAVEVRNDFPILSTSVRDQPLIYLDNAATTQKPRAVIDQITDYYTASNANIHRAVHFLSEKATRLHDEAREAAREFLNASSTDEIVFVRGTTEAINLVASSYGGSLLTPGDSIIISAMEHHSNIVPWQLVAEKTGASIKVIPMDHAGMLDMNVAASLLSDETARILALVHISNALGTVNPVSELIALARKHDVTTVIDGAQAAAHVKVDVRELGADFYAFSGHKIYGPTGIGVLYGRKELLSQMPPYQGGGDMIRTVAYETSTWNDLPYKFEAGTPDIAGAIALAAALRYVQQFDIREIAAHEQSLMDYATRRLTEFDTVSIIGNAPNKAGAISFIIDGAHPHDIGTFMDHEGVAIRTGHHCTQPVMDYYGIAATARLSFAMYNTKADIDAFCAALEKTIKILA